jgi:hypothetical protein
MSEHKEDSKTSGKAVKIPKFMIGSDLKVKIKFQGQVRDLIQLKQFSPIGSYSFPIRIVGEDGKVDLLEFSDQFFAGGESTRVYFAELDKDLLIWESIGRHPDLLDKIEYFSIETDKSKEDDDDDDCQGKSQTLELSKYKGKELLMMGRTMTTRRLKK